MKRYPDTGGNMDVPDEPYKASKGWQAVLQIGEEAKKNGTSEMTLAEINAEIDAYRAEKRRKSHERGFTDGVHDMP